MNERESFSATAFYHRTLFCAYLLVTALILPSTVKEGFSVMVIALVFAVPACVALFAPLVIPAAALLAALLPYALRGAKPLSKFLYRKLHKPGKVGP